MFDDRVSNLEATEELFVVNTEFTLVIELAKEELLFCTTEDSVSILVAREELLDVTVPYKDVIDAAADELFDDTVWLRLDKLDENDCEFAVMVNAREDDADARSEFS